MPKVHNEKRQYLQKPFKGLIKTFDTKKNIPIIRNFCLTIHGQAG
jgi:hypothetical protein